MRYLRKICTAKRIWTRPRKCSVLIYGESGTDILKFYISEPVHVYLQPNLAINVWVLLHACLHFRFNTDGYLHSYLTLTRPRVAITVEDNDIYFYRIKPLLPECSTIAIQNGRRDNFANGPGGGFFESLKKRLLQEKLDASTVVIFGSAVEDLYRAALGPSSQANYICLGNIRNNAVAPQPLKNKQSLVYISSLPSFMNGATPVSNEAVGVYHERSITYAQMWAAETFVVRKAAEYAKTNGMPFVVLGKRSNSHPGEFLYFSQLLEGLSWEFKAATTRNSSYTNISESDVLVAVDGTLAYEMFGRKYRVAYISARLAAAGIGQFRDCDFGFPLQIPRIGPFWTSELSESEVFRVISWVATASQTEWHDATENLRNRLMVYDPRNQKLCQLLTSLGVSNSGPRFLNEPFFTTN